VQSLGVVEGAERLSRPLSRWVKDEAEHLEWHKTPLQLVHDVLSLSFPELPPSNRGAPIVRGRRADAHRGPSRGCSRYLKLVASTQIGRTCSARVVRVNGHVASVGQLPAVNFLSSLSTSTYRAV